LEQILNLDVFAQSTICSTQDCGGGLAKLYESQRNELSKLLNNARKEALVKGCELAEKEDVSAFKCVMGFLSCRTF
jgi:hypothetical protein